MSVSKLNEREKRYVDGLLSLLEETSPSVRQFYLEELENQRNTLKLIASENYSSVSVQAAMGTLFTDKYAEGVPFHRFYAGCEVVDKLESECAEACRRLFGADFAYVQPHSGADANLVAYWAILSQRAMDPILEEIGEKNMSKLTLADFTRIREACHNQRLLSLDYYSGGHLTHGYRMNVSAQMFDVRTYSVSEKTFMLDYDDIEKAALEFKPLILLAGYSAYPRAINFRRLREIADKVGAVLMVDMAHFAGLVAGGVFSGDENPVAFADIVTSTTHKTLRGPRGGFILAKSHLAPFVEKGCPLVIGGPLEHVIAAKLVAFKEALKDDFKTYAANIVRNSRALAAELISQGVSVLTGGTDNHIVLVDVNKSFGLTGRQAESSLRSIGITLNRNALPFDVNGPWYTSGIRLGLGALTTRGFVESDMKEIASVIKLVLGSTRPAKSTSKDGVVGLSKTLFELDSKAESEAKGRIAKLLEGYPLYS